MSAPLSQDDWRRLSGLLQQVLDRPSAERDGLVDSLCGGDAALASELRALVAAHEQAGEFLEHPPALPDDLDPNSADGQIPEAAAAEAAAGPLSPGSRVGPYLVRREIGRGGMGVVYLADDLRLGRAVALKALPPETTRDPDRRKRLRREARAAAALSHPAIATVYAIEEIDGELYIAGEYVPGRTLRARLAAGPLPVDNLLDIAVAVAGALDASHTAGIVHRDLKPDNVLLGADGRVRVLDFGIASVAPGVFEPAAARLTASGAVFGTPAYMSPEQIEGREVDQRSDLFSFGVLLCEMATGTNPFEADTPLAAAARVLAFEPRPLAEDRPVPTDLDAIVSRCLAKRPSDRYARAADLLADLVRVTGSRKSGHAARATETPAPMLARARAWWAFHQVAVMVFFLLLYALVRWVVTWMPSGWRSVLVVSYVIPAVANGILRAHLLFTARFNVQGLARQLRRTRSSIAATDLLANAVLVAAGLLLLPDHLTPAVALAAAGIGNAVVAIWVEPATIEAAFPRALGGREER